jgi:superfamily II DNA or RNA helicase
MAAGKTRCAAAIVGEMIKRKKIERVVVITTSKTLLRSWVKAAHLYGVDLLATFEARKGIPPDCHGLVITYARLCTYYQEQMTSFAEYLRGYVTEVPTLIVFDEPHHLSTNEEDSSWGQSARTAFEFASYRLLLTGTPWRSDREAIPFVRYDPETKIVETDFLYSYRDALLDRVVRRVNFPLVDSAVSFQRAGRDKEIVCYASLEEAQKVHESDAVRTVLDIKVSQWLPTAIRDAHEELMQMRKSGDPRAGGLLVVSDAEEERMKPIVDMVRKETGCEPVVITSKVQDPQDRIDAFRDSDDPWVIAVQMISEGVDIPRLRVGVYGTNVKTRLAFRQFVGRFLRIVDDRIYDYASVYVIRIGDMITYVKEFEEEVYEALKEQAEECICGCGCKNGSFCPCGCKPDFEGCGCMGISGGDSTELLKISGTGEVRETYQSGLAYSEVEKSQAEKLRRQIPKFKDWSLTDIADVLREIEPSKSNGETPKPRHEKTKEQRRIELKNAYAKAVKDTVVKKRKSMGEVHTEEDFKRVQRKIIKKLGASSDNMTEEQLREAIKMVQQDFERLWS